MFLETMDKGVLTTVANEVKVVHKTEGLPEGGRGYLSEGQPTEK